MNEVHGASWHPCFTVGHALLDAQHKKLFKLCHMAAESLDASDWATRLPDLLNELMVHVVRHFRTEESLLDECAYDDLDGHKKTHEAYLEQLSRLLHASRSASLEREAVLACLNGWWVDHILDADKDYSVALSGW